MCTPVSDLLSVRVAINPFIMAPTFDESCLPPYLSAYWENLIEPGHYHVASGGWWPLFKEDQMGKVGYLTVHEGFVKAGTSQRRGGVHTECPGVLALRLDESDGKYFCVGNPRNLESPGEEDESEGRCVNVEQSVCAGGGWVTLLRVGWGNGGYIEENFKGGVYMASNIPDSCKIWNCSK